MNPLNRVSSIGAGGFEPPTSCSQSRRATELRHAPLLYDMVFEHRAFFARVVAARRSRVAIGRQGTDSLSRLAVAAIPALLLATTTPPSLAGQLPQTPAGSAATVDAQPPEPVPGATMTVHLITVGPGDRIEELWGHNAVLVRDTAAGIEETYNYGLFDMSDPGFYLDFYWGRGDYMVAPMDLEGMLAGYRRAGRRVWAQELALEPAAKVRLLGLLRTAVLPENRFYRYNYYLNNCSTKVRDILDVILGGQLRAATEGDRNGDAAGGPTATWRHDTRRLAVEDPLVYLGIQLLMGPRGDEPTTGWDDMWIPMKLRDTAGALLVTQSDGSRVPLVRSEELWEDADRDYADIAPPPLDVLFLLSGLLAGVILSLLGYGARARGRAARTGLIVFACGWGFFCLAISILIVALHWTAHTFTYWNQNFLLFSPLGSLVAASLVRTAVKGTTSVWGRRFTLLAMGLALIALFLHLIPPLAQGNREMLAFVLPLNLGFCWVMLGVHRADDALVYS